MLAKRILPCLDVKAGRVVKGTKFLNLRDAGNTLEIAASYDKEVADEIVLHNKQQILYFMCFNCKIIK